MSSVRDLLWELVKDRIPQMFDIVGTVTAVEQDAETEDWTVDVQPLDEEEAPFTGISLQAAPGKGVLMLPTVGSTVAITLYDEQTGFIGLFSDIDSITWLDGSYGGLIKISDLVGRLNLIEQKQNEILTALKSHTHPETGSTTSPSTDFNGISDLEETEVDQIENDKIKHGTTD